MHYNAMYISIASDAHGTSKGTRVRHPKAHNANHIERANLQSASALYVPLLHFRRKTAAFRSLPPLGLRPRKRSLRLQQKHEQRRTRQTIHERYASDPWFGFIRGKSSFVVVVPIYSHGIVLVRLQSCPRVWHSATAMCISKHERPPELVALVDALTPRR